MGGTLEAQAPKTMGGLWVAAVMVTGGGQATGCPHQACQTFEEKVQGFGQPLLCDI